MNRYVDKITNSIQSPTFHKLLDRGRSSRRVVLFIVFLALLLDNMLYTVVGKCTYTIRHTLSIKLTEEIDQRV